MFLQEYIPQVYYREYEEVEHTARIPSVGQVNDILICFQLVHAACSPLHQLRLQPTYFMFVSRWM